MYHTKPAQITNHPWHLSFRSDERRGAHLGGAVEGFLLVVVLILLLFPLENLPYVLERFVHSLTVARPSLPHKKLPVCVCKVQVLELHRDVIVCLVSQRLVVVVCPNWAEIIEPLTAWEGRTVDLLLEKVILVQNQNKWGVTEAWLPAQMEVQILQLKSLLNLQKLRHLLPTTYSGQLLIYL